MADHHLIGEFASAAAATKLASELTKFFEANAASTDDEPTATERALGKKYGFKWSEPLSWEDDPPIVVAIEDRVVVFHPYCAGGLGGDLAKVLAKAGGKRVREEDGPPVLSCTLTFPDGAPGKKLRAEFATLFAQRTTPSIRSWVKPVWAKFKMLGEAEDATFAVDGDTCTFTLPLNARDLASFRSYLEARKAVRVSITVATEKMIADNRAREARAESAASPPESAHPTTKPRVIPTTVPTVTVLHKAQKPLNVTSLHSDGTNALMVGFSGLHRSSDFNKLTAIGKPAQFQFHRSGVLLAGNTAWVCGYQGVLRSTDKGASFAEVSTDARVLHAIAADPEGIPWVVGDHGVQVFKGSAFVRVKCAEKGKFVSAVGSPLGALLLTDSGRVYIGRHAAITGGEFSARAPLRAACVTPAGTIVVVGGSKKPIGFRSEDGGKKFSPISVPGNHVLCSIVALPEGRLIAGGRLDTLFYSVDDGRSFKALKHPSTEQREFACATVHRGAAYLTAPFQELVRVT